MDDDEHDVDDPEIEDPIRARSREILSRVPSEAEIAEHEQRAKANRLARIMRGESETDPLRLVPRYPEVIHKRSDDARIADPGRDGQGPGAGAARASARPRAAPTGDEAALLEQWAERAANIVSMRPAEALREIVRSLGGMAIAAHRQRVLLEERVAKLERRGKRTRKRLKRLSEARKPRVRVPARRLEVVP